MGASQDHVAELLELLGAAWDGTLDDASFARLEELLANNADGACEVAVAFSRMQVELAWLAASAQAHDKALSRLRPEFEASSKVTIPLPTDRSNATIARTPTPSKRDARQSRRRWLAIAAGLLVPLTAASWYIVGHWMSPDATDRIIVLSRGPRKVARFVASSPDAAWRVAPHGTGDLLSQGERLDLLNGTAQLSMASGADLLLQAPCTVELTSEKSARLVDGVVTVEVAAWAKGFAIDAPGMRIVDLGTRFAVATDAQGNSQAHVFAGLVQAESLSAPSAPSAERKSLSVKAGEAIAGSRDQSQLTRIPIARGRFQETLPSFRPLKPIDVANTGRGRAIGASDPRWRIIAGHASGGVFPAHAVVSNPAIGHVDSGLNQSQWISVRGGTTRGVERYTQYTFATEFNLSGIDPDTVHLIGQVLVDNRVQEIRLNGKPTDLPPWQTYTAADFSRFHTIELRDGFVGGVNRIEFDVINGATVDSLTHNPMALRVEWQAFGCVADEAPRD